MSGRVAVKVKLSRLQMAQVAGPPMCTCRECWPNGTPGGQQELPLPWPKRGAPRTHQHQQHVDMMRHAGYVTHHEAAAAVCTPRGYVRVWLMQRLEKWPRVRRDELYELYSVWFPGWLLEDLARDIANGVLADLAKEEVPWPEHQ